jgi:hypothetical protein
MITPGRNNPRIAGNTARRAFMNASSPPPGCKIRGFIHITRDMRQDLGGLADLGMFSRDLESALDVRSEERQALELLDTANDGGYFEGFRGAPYSFDTRQRFRLHAERLLAGQFPVEVEVVFRADGSVAYDCVYKTPSRRSR